MTDRHLEYRDTDPDSSQRGFSRKRKETDIYLETEHEYRVIANKKDTGRVVTMTGRQAWEKNEEERKMYFAKCSEGDESGGMIVYRLKKKKTK